ncbi:MAG: hypothetical protein QM662_15170, partial [Gordonia sp. (in: high G+C Gram-positive bacteria)]
ARHDRRPPAPAADALEQRIVATSLRFGVLCRFTAFVAVDDRVVAEGGPGHRVIQPVEPPRGWDLGGPPGAAPLPMSSPLLGSAPRAMSAAAGPAPAAALPCGAPPPSPMPGAPKRSRRGRTPAGDGARAMRPSQDHPELVAARAQARDEVRRLRARCGLPAAAKRSALDDLASRLRALVAHLNARGVAAAAYGSLTGLLTDLDSHPDPEQMWQTAIEVLDTFAGSAPEPRRWTFWKRG